ncbi:hypothetical protein A2U01_0095141, partial [Trifolium medium]|nr:hypothetical protein [Trifolium medium]
ALSHNWRSQKGPYPKKVDPDPVSLMLSQADLVASYKAPKIRLPNPKDWHS